MANPDRITYFAATDSRGKRTPFGIKAKDRARHMYVIGKTGMGKSTLLENMAIQDIQNGEGMAFIDPHGSAVDKLLDFIPEHRVKDVVYFAPFDLEHPMAFNVMEDVGYDKRHLVTSGLMATFKKIWEDAWSARMEYILTNTLLALLEYPDSTLLGVNRMYTDKAYRKKVVDNVKDPIVKDFWTKEFAGYTDRFTQEATPAIQNKIGQFTSNPLIRNIIGQPHSSFDFRDLMDQKKIVLINLSKGLVGDVNMRLLGSMITTRIFLGAMSRADLPGHELAKAPPFYFYVDEFQNFANETFAEILSEARKYNLNLLMAHQYVEQMEEEVRAAVFGNVGTSVAFRVGPFDAETLETVFAPEFTQEDLVNLGFAQIYLTLMIDGIGSRPFSAVTIPPIEAPPRSFRTEVIANSRAQFGTARAGVEEAIYSELALTDTPAMPEPAKRPFPGERREVVVGGTTAPRERMQPRPQSAAPRPQPSYDRPRADAPRQDAPRPQPREAIPSHEPRRESPPAPRVQQNDRAQAPRPEQRPERQAPRAAERTPDDLKSILRATIQKADTEKGKREEKKGTDLKGALAGVLPKESAPLPPPAPNPAKRTEQSHDDREPAPPPQPQPAPHTPQNGRMPAPGATFEVPEQVLKDIFKETI